MMTGLSSGGGVAGSGHSLQKPDDDGDCLVACLITRNNSEL